MADTGENRTFGSADILYLATFALGMAAFWIGGKANIMLPAMSSANMAFIASLAVTQGIYGLLMFVLAFFATGRKLLPAVVSTIVAVVLGYISAQVIVSLAKGKINDTQDLGILTFVLFLCYGGIYVLALVIGRKIAKNRAA